jgi:hypothetical protein
VPFIEPNLRRFEKKIRSQFGEDGVIGKVAECLGIECGTFFEFGVGPAWQRPLEDGLEGNFVLLAERGWRGVFLDGATYPPEYGVGQEFVTPLNINQLYRKHNLPADLDFLSIDVDGQEFWIWMALQCRPKVVLTEYNGGLPLDASVTILFDAAHIWDGTLYHGASLRALNKLAVDKGYTLVWSNGVNAMFVQSELVANASAFDLERLFVSFPSHAPDPKLRKWVDV